MNKPKCWSGQITVEIVCAEPMFLVEELLKRDVSLYDVEVENMTLCITLSSKVLSLVRALTKQYGGTLRIKERSRAYYRWYILFRRPILVVGVLCLLLGTWLLSSKILFIQVIGNEAEPANEILEHAELCGIRFGASRRNVRSEAVKNMLLTSVPELQWVGINTAGCLATIQVREREQADGQAGSDAVSSIVATSDGVIVSVTTLRGTALCQPGQAVKAGQALVSGYTDSGILIKAGGADAEILAQTRRTVTAVAPVTSTSRGKPLSQKKKYSIRIGKKIINFDKDSGISDTTCVKIYNESSLTLPGGFSLPIALVTQTCITYDTNVLSASSEDVQMQMESFVDQYLSAHMVSGQILKTHTQVQPGEQAYAMDGEYICLEMIGCRKYEETILHDGRNS